MSAAHARRGKISVIHVHQLTDLMNYNRFTRSICSLNCYEVLSTWERKTSNKNWKGKRERESEEKIVMVMMDFECTAYGFTVEFIDERIHPFDDVTTIDAFDHKSNRRPIEQFYSHILKQNLIFDTYMNTIIVHHFGIPHQSVGDECWNNIDVKIATFNENTTECDF